MPEKPELRDDLYPVKSATAVLAACVVETLNESDPSFRSRFLATLEKAYLRRREEVGDDLHELEVLSWTRELLTGFNIVSGQGKPFLDD